VVLHLNRHKRYPGTARMNDQQGDVHVRFSMDRSGQLTAPSARVADLTGTPAVLRLHRLKALRDGAALSPDSPDWPLIRVRWSTA